MNRLQKVEMTIGVAMMNVETVEILSALDEIPDYEVWLRSNVVKATGVRFHRYHNSDGVDAICAIAYSTAFVSLVRPYPGLSFLVRPRSASCGFTRDLSDFDQIVKSAIDEIVQDVKSVEGQYERLCCAVPKWNGEWRNLQQSRQWERMSFDERARSRKQLMDSVYSEYFGLYARVPDVIACLDAINRERACPESQRGEIAWRGTGGVSMSIAAVDILCQWRVPMDMDLLRNYLLFWIGCENDNCFGRDFEDLFASRNSPVRRICMRKGCYVAFATDMATDSDSAKNLMRPLFWQCARKAMGYLRQAQYNECELAIATSNYICRNKSVDFQAFKLSILPDIFQSANCPQYLQHPTDAELAQAGLVRRGDDLTVA